MSGKLKYIKRAYAKRKSMLYLANLLLGIAKIIVGLITAAYVFCISALYNIAVGFSKREVNRKAGQVRTGLLIVLSGLIYAGYSVFVFITHRNSSYHMYVALVIAMVTFTQITLSIIGIVKAGKVSNRDMKVEKLSNLANGVVSLALTQNAILSFTNEGSDMSAFVALGGVVFSAVSVLIGIRIIFYNKKSMENKSIAL